MITAQRPPSVETQRFLHDVLNGLARRQKRLPSKYFYDVAGSRLFDRITELDEYYLTRTELSIMRQHAAAMVKWFGSNCLLIELGAGSLTKVRLLLDQLNHPAGFVPVDVSGEHLRMAAAELAADYPSLDVRPMCGDFTRDIPIPSVSASHRVVYFPGSTIGNFDPADADDLLRRIARMAAPDGGLLLGVDLRKDTAVLEAAYNDCRGVTAAFNLNLLTRINRELDADFDLSAFDHRAIFNAQRSRIEMHLVSTADQDVHIADRTIAFRKGETIHTENSYKYDLDELAVRAAGCGLRMDATWTDEREYFAVLYLTAVAPA